MGAKQYDISCLNRINDETEMREKTPV